LLIFLGGGRGKYLKEARVLSPIFGLDEGNHGIYAPHTTHTDLYSFNKHAPRGPVASRPPPPPRAPPPLRHPSAAPDRGPLPPATLHPIPGFVCHINKPHPGGGGVLWPHVTNEGCARKSSCPSPFRSLSPCRSLHNPGGGVGWKIAAGCQAPLPMGGGVYFPLMAFAPLLCHGDAEDGVLPTILSF